MNDINPIDFDTLNLLLDRLPSAFNECSLDCAQLIQQIDKLEETHCTGSEHWRDTNKSKHAPKLYVIHRTDVACPVHGTPAHGKRIRSYVGSNAGNIETARAAIAQGSIYLQAKQDIRRKTRNIQSAIHTLQRVYWALELKTPSVLADEPE